MLALAFACRLDKLLETPRPLGLGVAPDRVAESAPEGNEARPRALMVSSPSRVINWTAHTDSASSWLDLTDTSGRTPDSLRFTLNTNGLTPGMYRETIVVAARDSTTSTVRVPVELRINAVSPTTGDLSVRVGTSGGTPDPDGYAVTIDGAQSRPLAINDTTLYSGLAPRSYTVQLGDLAPNCTVTGGATRSGVAVSAGQTAAVTFAVNCPTTPPPTGDLKVRTTTTGATPDPDGYTVTIDGGQSRTIANNDSTTYTLAASTYTVVLGDIASNCTVTNGASSRTVSVTAGQTRTETFAVSCPTPPPPTGTLTVSASTTPGGTPDPNGYTVTVDGGQLRTIGINGSTTYTLAAGSYTVDLGDVATNCTVSGGTSRTVTVTAGQPTSVPFAVDCPTPPPPTGTLTVSASTTPGGTPDPNGYTVTVNGGQLRNIGINGSTTYDLAPASYTVDLGDLATNCTVSGGTSRTVTVTAGQPTSVPFAVDCPTPPPPTGDLTVSAATTGGTPDPSYSVTVDGGQMRTIGTNGSTTYTGLTASSHTVQIGDLASNCAVSGQNPRSVNVPAGSSASTTFNVDCPTPPPPATHLDFTTQPPATIILSTTFSVTVTALNDQGGVATGFTGAVQLTLQGPITVGGLQGTTQVNAVGGVARFTNLQVTGLCVGCSLVANAGGLTGATSRTFSVVLGQ